MEDVFFSLNISGDLGLTAFSLPLTRQRELHVRRDHESKTGEANEGVVCETVNQWLSNYVFTRLRTSRLLVYVQCEATWRDRGEDMLPLNLGQGATVIERRTVNATEQ